MIQAVSIFLEYLLDFTPPTDFGLQTVIWVILAINLAVAILIPIWVKLSNSKILARVLNGFTSKLLVIEAFLIINIFSRFYRIDVLSMRLLTFFLLLWLLATYATLAIAIFKKWPEKKAALQKDPSQQNRRYHIHKNKKRHS